MKKTVSDQKKPLTFSGSGHFTKKEFSGQTAGNSSTIPVLGTSPTTGDNSPYNELKSSLKKEEKNSDISPVKRSPLIKKEILTDNLPQQRNAVSFLEPVQPGQVRKGKSKKRKKESGNND